MPRKPVAKVIPVFPAETCAQCKFFEAEEDGNTWCYVDPPVVVDESGTTSRGLFTNPEGLACRHFRGKVNA